MFQFASFHFPNTNANFHSGSSQKKLLAPDMFTESDDMFAAYFDVSIFSHKNIIVKVSTYSKYVFWWYVYT